MRKTVMILTVLTGLVLGAQAGKRADNITMLIVPREARPVQIAQDIAYYYPTLLLTYNQTPEGLALHAWNGSAWVSVSPEDYRTGAFFMTSPRRCVIVDSEEAPAPEALIPDGTWCPAGKRLASTDPRVLIHLLGRYFDFPQRRWKLFAKRYDYTIDEINPAMINIQWWHYSADVYLDKLRKRQLSRDMDKWYDLGITPPVPVYPAPMEDDLLGDLPALPEAPAMAEPAGTTNEKSAVEEILEELDEKAEPVTAPETTVETNAVNPFSTEDMPEAEIVLPKE